MQAIGDTAFARPQYLGLSSRAVESRGILVAWAAAFQWPRDSMRLTVSWKRPDCGSAVDDEFELSWGFQSLKVQS